MSCVYCGEPIVGAPIFYGDQPLHESCMEEIQTEAAEFQVDTDVPKTTAELAASWALHTRSTEKESVDAGFDPDDYDLF